MAIVLTLNVFISQNHVITMSVLSEKDKSLVLFCASAVLDGIKNVLEVFMSLKTDMQLNK